jgi:hypothetical protein
MADDNTINTIATNMHSINLRLESLESAFSAIRDNLPTEPIKYFSFPKWLVHLERSYAAPVMVNTLQQEEEYRAKGYVAKFNETSTEEDFFVTKVYQRVKKQLDLYLQQQREIMKQNTRLQEQINSIHDYIAELIEDKNEDEN